MGGQAKRDMKVRTVTLTKESPTNSDESGNFQLERCKPTKAQWAPLLGDTLSRRLAGEYSPLFPRYVLPDGPPDARGPLEVLVGLFLAERVGRTRFFYSQSPSNILG